MTSTITSKAPPATGGPCCISGCDEVRHVTRTGVVKPRCPTHHQEQTAAMRLRQRGRPAREERACTECGESFTWKAEFPKQETCGKSCYMRRRQRHLELPPQAREHRNEVRRVWHARKQAAKYGLTVEEYEARRWGACEGCERIDAAPLHLDHCHGTGRLRGFLCEKCNHALGNVYDSPATLRRLAAYLEQGLVRSTLG